jgi:hypothetical protein
MTQPMKLEDLRKLRQQQQEIAKQLEGAKALAVDEVAALAKEWELTYGDVKKIFPAPRKKKKNADGTTPKMKYRTPEGAEWAGTGANPPKAFVSFIKQNKLHDLCTTKSPENIEAAKKYAANWNTKNDAKTATTAAAKKKAA